MDASQVRSPDPLGRLEAASLSDRVAASLRAAIFDGAIAPGSRLVERSLAETFGISHIPVREAIARLTEEGLVERLPRRGARVVRVDGRTLSEISAIRILLEQFVALRVHARWGPQIEAELRRVVDAMVEAAEQRDPLRLVKLDRSFHERLWELADNSIALEIAAQLRGRIAFFLSLATQTLDERELVDHARSHAGLVDSLAAADPTACQEAMRAHIRTAEHRIREALESSRDGDRERWPDRGSIRRSCVSGL